MGVVLGSGSEFEIVNSTSTDGVVSTITANVGLPKVFSDWVADGHLSWDTLDASLGYDRTFGTPWGGYEITIERNPSTNKITLGGAVSGGALGGSFEVVGTVAADGKIYIDIDSVDVFGGMQVILGDQREFLGFSTGVGGKAQAGVFFDYDSNSGYDLGAGFGLGMTQGLYLGTLDTNVELIFPILHADELSIENLRTIMNELFPSSLEDILSSPFPIMAILTAYFGKQAAAAEIANFYGIEECFVSGTKIDMWPADDLERSYSSNLRKNDAKTGTWQKSIEDITPGDLVISFDKNGDLKPGKVTRVFTNEAKIILDFFGTGVTPGHVFYRADSEQSNKFETIIDILRDDGVIQTSDGTEIRACTGAAIGTPLDALVQAVTGEMQPDGHLDIREQKTIRVGCRVILDDGRDFSIADIIEAGGGTLREDGLIATDTCPDGVPFHWTYSETLPNPEHYILKRSGTTLIDIYKAAEWDGQQPHMPTPMVLDGGPVQPLSQTGLSKMPRNTPLSMREDN